MTQKTSIDQVTVGLSAAGVRPAEETSSPAPISPNDPFCILVMGDFSGRSSRGICDPGTVSSRALHWIDRDNFEEVMSRLEPRLALNFGESDERQELSFRELDDFHPDQLFQSVESFDRLRRLRRQLRNADTFNAAAAKLGAITPSQPRPSESATAEQGNTELDASEQASLLDSALAATDSDTTAGSKSIVDRLVEQAIAPYVIPAADPRQADLIASVDAGITDLMRRLLHHPSFQELESNWRGLWSLVRHLETDGQLKIRVLDVSLDELRDGVSDSEVPNQSPLKQRIIDGLVQTPGEIRPTVLALCSEFQSTPADVELLGALAQIAAAAGAPLLTGAAAELVGLSSFDRVPDIADWSPLESEYADALCRLRSASAARYLGVTMPRVLMRRGYEGDTDAFDFEEISPAAEHREFLWGNGALLVARLIGEAFSVDGWNLNLDHPLEVGDMPMCIFEEDGEKVAKPCAEGLLSDRAAAKISEFGFIPLQSYRGQDRIRVGGIHSMSDALTPLAGRWD